MRAAYRQIALKLLCHKSNLASAAPPGWREHGQAVLLAFSLAQHNLGLLKIYIFDAQAQGFHTCACAALARKCRRQAQTPANTSLGHLVVQTLHPAQLLVTRQVL